MRKNLIDNASVEIHERRWALIVLCLGALMISLDGTIVNVALPIIAADLRFPETSLVWVVNAYFVPFAGFLLLGGRLGDLFGHRRLFLLGITLFTLASLGCGLASSQGTLIGARAVQGIGGAIVSAVSLSMVLHLFVEPYERAKAMGVFGFVSISGGGIALSLGGTLTSLLGWHWIFLINIPVGTAVYLLGLVCVPNDGGRTRTGRLDVAGASTVTAALVIALYAVVNRNEPDRNSAHTLVLLFIATVVLLAFLFIEARVSAPLIPLGLFRLRNLVSANIIEMLTAASLYSWLFISTLYLQLVLGYSPLQVGFAFLPCNQITAAFMLGLSARLVIRFGIKPPLVIGLLLAAAGYALFALAPIGARFTFDVLPGTLMVGIGLGMASTPLLLAAMSEVAPGESGLASGVVNTASMIGAAIGLAILVSAADARTKELAASGEDTLVALNGGYHVAFFIAAALTIIAAFIGAAFLGTGQNESVRDHKQKGAAVSASVCDD